MVKRSFGSGEQSIKYGILGGMEDMRKLAGYRDSLDAAINRRLSESVYEDERVDIRFGKGMRFAGLIVAPSRRSRNDFKTPIYQYTFSENRRFRKAFRKFKPFKKSDPDDLARTIAGFAGEVLDINGVRSD